MAPSSGAKGRKYWVVVAALAAVAVVAVASVVVYRSNSRPSPGQDDEVSVEYVGPAANESLVKSESPIRIPRADVNGFVSKVDAIFYGVPRFREVVSRDGVAYTAFDVSVKKSVKGEVPSSVTVIQIGGSLNGKYFYSDGAAPIVPNKEYLLSVVKMGDSLVAVPDLGAELVDADNSQADAIVAAAGGIK